LAVAKEYNIQSELLPKIATGFCSGIARTSGQCGALSGAILGLGLITGRSEPGASVDSHYAQVRELIERFDAQFGSQNCAQLTGCDLATEDGQTQFQESGQFDRCLDYSEAATRMVLEILND
jgi:C_GCAxxG_C_C family probable redox protein